MGLSFRMIKPLFSGLAFMEDSGSLPAGPRRGQVAEHNELDEPSIRRDLCLIASDRYGWSGGIVRGQIGMLRRVVGLQDKTNSAACTR